MKKTTNPYVHSAGIFRLLAHPARLHILDELRRGAACVCHLQTVLKRPQAYVSQQLKILRDAEVLDADKDGLNVYYRIVNQQVLDMLQVTLGPASLARSVPGCPCPKCASGNCGMETTNGESSLS